MRIKALLVLAALTAVGAPAFAQRPVQTCQEARANNQIGGAVVGSILGGVLGSNVAARGHRGDGTAVGAVVGGLLGAGVGGSSTRCHSGYQPPGYGQPSGSSYNPNPNYGGPYYSGGNDSYRPYDGYGYDDDSRYRYGDSVYDRPLQSDIRPRDRYDADLDGDYRSAYKQNDDFAGSDCSTATSVTRMPDGSEIHRPVVVCHDAYSGEWRVRK